jgi:hypothetical protein
MCNDFILLFKFYEVGSDTGIGNSLSMLQITTQNLLQSIL